MRLSRLDERAISVMLWIGYERDGDEGTEQPHISGKVDVIGVTFYKLLELQSRHKRCDSWGAKRVTCLVLHFVTGISLLSVSLSQSRVHNSF